MPYFTPQGLDHLKVYRYESSLQGYIDSVIMTPFWNFAVTLLPLWLAPNLVTLLALSHVSLCCGVMMYYAPTLTEECPRWVYFLAFYCLFMYQTLDAIDGKQARRTGSSSPLGQLFDHGCDALCCTCTSLAISVTLQAGSTWLTYAILALHLIPFYMSNWEECQTGRMRFGAVGVTEAQMFFMILFSVTGFYGPSVWQVRVMNMFDMKQAIIGFALFLIVFAIKDNVTIVMEYYASKPKTSATKTTRAIRQLLQFVILMFFGTLWVFSPSNVYEKHCRELIVIIGLSFAYLVSRMIIHHVSDMSYPLIAPVLYLLPFASLHSVFLTQKQLIDETIVIHIVLVYVTFFYLHFVISVVTEICEFLNISCFTITVAKNRSIGTSGSASLETTTTTFVTKSNNKSN